MRNLLLLSLFFVVSVSALVYSPRIQVNEQVDCSSFETILQGILKPGMSDEEKAIAVWRLIQAKTFHYKAPLEGPDRFELYTLQDALKIINVYGYTYCYAFVSLTSSLWRAAGLDSTRIWGMPGHLVSEVYYDKSWHYFDADQCVAAYFLKPDGKTIASVEDLRNAPDAMIVDNPFRSNPSMPYNDKPLYVHEARKVLADMLRQKDKHNTRDWVSLNTHTMDYYLRKNEQLTLYFEPQGRWRHQGLDAPAAFIQPSKGPYDAHGPRTYGNGLFEYVPNLNDTGTLSEGFFSSMNVHLFQGGLTPIDSTKAGEAVVKVASPYIITGVPVSPSFTTDPFQKFHDVACLSGRIRGSGALMGDPVEFEVQISTDKMVGRFETVYRQTNGGFFSLDLSPWFTDPTYDYRLKFILRKSSKPGAAMPRLDSLSIKTWVEANPATFPQLVSGENRLSFSASGPAVDQVEVVSYSDSNSQKPAVWRMDNAVYTKDLRKRIIQKDSTKAGVAYFELSAPEGPLYDYALSLISFARAGMKTTLFYSENDTLHWVNAEKPPKLYNDHWKDPFALRVRTVGKNVQKVYFKVVIEGGAAICTFDYTYRYHYKKATGKVTVVQSAEVDGRLKSFSTEFTGEQGVSKIRVNGKRVENKSVQYRVE